MLRALFALCAALLAAMVVMTASGFANAALFPQPSSLDASSPSAIAGYVATMPTQQHALLLAGWLLAVAVGAAVAAKLAPRHALPLALAIGVLVAVLDFLNAVQVHRPGWVLAIGVALPVPLALLVVRTIRRVSPAPGK